MRSVRSVIGAGMLACGACETPNPCPAGMMPVPAQDRCVVPALDTSHAVDGSLFPPRDAASDAGAAARPDTHELDSGSGQSQPGRVFDAMTRIDADSEPPGLDSNVQMASDTGVQAADGGDAAYEWRLMPGFARDLAITENGHLWCIGLVPAEDGAHVHKWTGLDWAFVEEGSGFQIAVEPSGEPWVVTVSGLIVRRTTSDPLVGDWVAVPGCAKDIAIGPEGQIWSVSCVEASEGYVIQEWTGAEWRDGGGSGVRIVVGPEGVVWTVDQEARIHRLDPGSAAPAWQEIPGVAYDLTIRADGVVYALAPPLHVDGYTVQQRDENGSWIPLVPEGVGTSITANARSIWLVNSYEEIYQLELR